MKNLNIIFIIIGIGVSILIAGVAMSTTHKTNLVSEEIKLINGEITVFQYCAHIGKAAVDDDNCIEYNLIYGSRS